VTVVAAGTTVTFQTPLEEKKNMSADTPSTTTINLGAVTTLVDQNDLHDVGGSQQLAALRMAVNEFNDKTDGILDDLLPDVQVKLAVRDGRDDFAQSVIHGLEFTNKMFKSVGGIHAVLSFAGDDVTKGLASVLSTADVPLLTSTTVAELSKADRYPTTLRLLPSDAYQGATFGQLMKSSHWDVRRVIAFSSTDSFDTLLEFTTAAKAHGVKVVDSYVIEDFQEDFSDVIKDAKAHRCKNFVFFNKRAADASLLLLQGADVGLFSPLSTLFFHQQLHSDELHAAVVAKHGPAILRGAVVLTPLTDAWKHRSAGQAFLKRYLAQPDTVAADAQCDDAVDDTGRPVYVSETGEGAALCAGLRFSEMARDGRDVSPLVAYAYDAVVVYLRAVEHLLQTGAVTHGQVFRRIHCLPPCVVFLTSRVFSRQDPPPGHQRQACEADRGGKRARGRRDGEHQLLHGPRRLQGVRLRRPRQGRGLRHPQLAGA